MCYRNSSECHIKVHTFFYQNQWKSQFRIFWPHLQKVAISRRISSNLVPFLRECHILKRYIYTEIIIREYLNLLSLYQYISKVLKYIDAMTIYCILFYLLNTVLNLLKIHSTWSIYCEGLIILSVPFIEYVQCFLCLLLVASRGCDTTIKGRQLQRKHIKNTSLVRHSLTS